MEFVQYQDTGAALKDNMQCYSGGVTKQSQVASVEISGGGGRGSRTKLTVDNK